VPFLDSSAFSALCGQIMASCGDAATSQQDVEEINRYFCSGRRPRC
jgi:hypothetical protein